VATVAPVLRAELRLSNYEYGWIVAAFSITYAVCSPFAGLLMDRIGLHRGIVIAVGLWSMAALSTGWVARLQRTAGMPAMLGVAEAGGIPGSRESDPALSPSSGARPRQQRESSGRESGADPCAPIATWFAVQYNWRTAFLATGVLGLLWIPLWRLVGGNGGAESKPSPSTPGGLLRDKRLWIFALANALSIDSLRAVDQLDDSALG
jgi:ACS family hexuronate transporter-like MFS transporter